MFLLLFLTFFPLVILKKHLYPNLIQEISIQGQIVTPSGDPLGIIISIQLQTSYSTISTNTDIDGNFIFKAQITSGDIIINFQSQFTQTYAFKGTFQNGVLNLGKIEINNNETEDTLITGHIEDAITGIGIAGATITIDYYQPINLGAKKVSSDDNGDFQAPMKLMKLLVYGVDLSVEAQGYQLWQCSKQSPLICPKGQGLALYNQFKYTFSNILLTSSTELSSATVMVKVDNMEGVQVSGICQGLDSTFVMQPQLTNKLGIVQLKIDDIQKNDYYCMIWTYRESGNDKYHLIQMKKNQMYWDDTSDPIKL